MFTTTAPTNSTSRATDSSHSSPACETALGLSTFVRDLASDMSAMFVSHSRCVLVSSRTLGSVGVEKTMAEAAVCYLAVYPAPWNIRRAPQQTAETIAFAESVAVERFLPLARHVYLKSRGYLPFRLPHLLASYKYLCAMKIWLILIRWRHGVGHSEWPMSFQVS